MSTKEYPWPRIDYRPDLEPASIHPGSALQRLKSNTHRPWELIVVDNGSTDHTDIYLAGVSDGLAVLVTVISNTTNRGFPAAINQGLNAARGEYLVLLNNDVVVTDSWLDQLIALATAKRRTTAEMDRQDDGCARDHPPNPPFARGEKFSRRNVLMRLGTAAAPLSVLSGRCPSLCRSARPLLRRSVPLS